MSILLLAGNGFSLERCHMQKTHSNHMTGYEVLRLSHNSNNCIHNDQNQRIKNQSINGRYGNPGICNCTFQTYNMLEVRLAMHENFAIHAYYTLRQNDMTFPLQIKTGRHPLPPVSSDAKPLYLRNRILLI